jgi:hypothetical protein
MNTRRKEIHRNEYDLEGGMLPVMGRFAEPQDERELQVKEVHRLGNCLGYFP